MKTLAGPQAHERDGDKPRAIGYVRVSSQKQHDDGFSIESQEESIREYADENGYHLADILVDVISTKNPNANRSGFYGVISRIEAGSVDAVLIRGTSRLGRNMPDKVMLGTRAETHGVEIVGVDGAMHYDMASPLKEFQYYVESAMDRLKNRQRAHLVREARRKRAKNGYWPQGNPPTGYTTVQGDKGRVLEPDENAWFIRQAYEYYIDVQSGPRVEQWARNLPADVPSGKNVMGKILRNKVYAGLIHWDGEWYEGRHEAIVPKWLWNRAWEVRRSGPGRPTSDEPIP